MIHRIALKSFIQWSVAFGVCFLGLWAALEAVTHLWEPLWFSKGFFFASVPVLFLALFALASRSFQIGSKAWVYAVSLSVAEAVSVVLLGALVMAWVRSLWVI